MIRIFKSIWPCILFISLPAWGQQGSNDTIHEGFENSINNEWKEFDTEEILDYLSQIKKEDNSIVIGGFIISVFREPIDSIKVKLYTIPSQKLIAETYVENGLYSFQVSKKDLQESYRITTENIDYFPSDSVIQLKGKPQDVYAYSPVLRPKYKIALKGRVYAGNLPLEGANVLIEHNSNNYHLNTKGCYYDKEDYWNCLFDGMFLKEIVTKNVNDTVHLTIEKKGLRTIHDSFLFKEYSGKLLTYRMRYENMIPDIPSNQLSLKLAPPFLSNGVWYIDLSYYRHIKKLKRISLGIDGTTFIIPHTSEFNTFPNAEKGYFDTTYIATHAGPSVLFEVTAPNKRYFNTHLGMTYAFGLNQNKHFLIPFVGTKFFLDMSKSLNIELRYYRTGYDGIEYTFNPYGDPKPYTKETILESISLNIGLHLIIK